MSNDRIFNLLSEDDIAELRAQRHAQPRTTVDNELRVAGANILKLAPDAPEPEAPEVVDPVDPWASLDPPTLARGILPDVLEQFAFEQGQEMGADIGGIALAALVVCGAAIPDSVQVQVKRHNKGWLESARFWGWLVGLPSTMKTPVMRAAARPLRSADGIMARQYEEARAHYDSLTKDEKAATPAPKNTRLVLQDTTIEAAQEVLKDSPNGILCYQDELSGWFGSFDKYASGRGASKDRAFWLEAFNGGAYSVNRVSRGSSYIENLSISVLGGIQPEPIRKIMEDSVDDGLLQRGFTVMMKGAVAGQDVLEGPATHDYAVLIGQLRHLDEIVLRFEEGAHVYREELERKHLALQSCETLYPKLGAHIGKFNGLFARLCVVFHCVENAGAPLPSTISEATARRAGGLLHGFLLPHAVCFYTGSLGVSDTHANLLAVAGYILAHKLKKISKRDVARGDRTMRRLDPKQVEAVFEQLDAMSWIDRNFMDVVTRKPDWIVNPAVHTKFEKKAKEEKSRRERDKKMIADMLKAKKGDPDNE